MNEETLIVRVWLLESLIVGEGLWNILEVVLRSKYKK